MLISLSVVFIFLIFSVELISFSSYPPTTIEFFSPPVLTALSHPYAFAGDTPPDCFTPEVPLLTFYLLMWLLYYPDHLIIATMHS